MTRPKNNEEAINPALYPKNMHQLRVTLYCKYISKGIMFLFIDNKNTFHTFNNSITNILSWKVNIFVYRL